MTDLFEFNSEKLISEHTPLADRIRPQTLDQFIGQEEIMGVGKPLRVALEKARVHSAIFWGPPGCGKTTLAYLISRHLKSLFIALSAVTSGKKEVMNVMRRAENEQTLYGRQTILFVDEIHRFNKAQQDAFLPFVESGKIVLLGATTENPSFEVIGALLSRLKVYLLKPLTEENLSMILAQALSDKKRGLGEYDIELDDSARNYIIQTSAGDARRALTLLEITCQADPQWQEGRAKITFEKVTAAHQKKTLLYDKSGEEHYNLISALHKSMRDSDPDASLYWLARMLEAGEEPLYIARRMVRFAIEDIGLADPNALTTALNAKESYRFLGSPEGELSLAMAVIYLAASPKSNSVYKAYKTALQTIADEPAYEVPPHIRNAVTPLMKQFGYGKGYQYAHDFEDAITGQSDLPEQLKTREFYHPSKHGNERRLGERLHYFQQLRDAARKKRLSDAE